MRRGGELVPEGLRAFRRSVRWILALSGALAAVAVV